MQGKACFTITRRNVGVAVTLAIGLSVTACAGRIDAGSTNATFDVSLDNVRLITETEARDATNHCDTAMLGKPPGSGNAG